MENTNKPIGYVLQVYFEDFGWTALSRRFYDNKNSAHNSMTDIINNGSEYQYRIIPVFENENSFTDNYKKQICEIEDLLNLLHKDMAKSIIDINTYNPLSSHLIEIKQKIYEIYNNSLKQ